MTCQELDRVLDPYLDGEFEQEERLEVEAHLAQCAGCAQRVHSEAQLRQALRRAARQAVDGARAPERLRLSVQAGLQRETRRGQGGVLMRAGAAAMVMAVAGGTWVALRPQASTRLLEDAARRHARPLPIEIADTSHEGVEAWFWGKLDHRVPVPRLANATVRGGRMLNVSDRPAAYISYESAPAAHDGPPRRIGLFVFGDAERQVDAQALPSVQLGTSHGYNVALWREGELVYELVTDLDEASIRHMLAHSGRGTAASSAPARAASSSPPPGLPVTPALHHTP